MTDRFFLEFDSVEDKTMYCEVTKNTWEEIFQAIRTLSDILKFKKVSIVRQQEK